MGKSNLITIPKLAELLGISRIAVYNQVRAGKIAATKVGRIHVINDRTVQQVLRKRVGALDKQRVDQAVRKVVRDYGEVLKRLARE
ncbi:helix-turn-helix domain-containing protein [Anaerobaca lacustris]|uniref:Helix-turn-helix domain-containing protein n=1 Tax=Anaerobaca lacustris TaxID=3044600 RepID=A0AAW6U379_9BACT|nr:helix-turn-helix domain-containing protein [Sedimentisphaerales bacterium M17dextr]